MASATDLSIRVPQLPAEIWRVIFGNFNTTEEDLAHLWLECRLVSRLFKEETEHMVAHKFVPKISILISSETPTKHRDKKATEKLSITWWEGLKYSGGFTFGKFSDYGHRAVFHYDCPSDRYTSTLFQILKDQELLRNVMKMPCYEVRWLQRVAHIPLPDLTVDVVEHSLTLDWRQLLSAFFAKEKKKGQEAENVPLDRVSSTLRLDIV